MLTASVAAGLTTGSTPQNWPAIDCRVEQPCWFVYDGVIDGLAGSQTMFAVPVSCRPSQPPHCNGC